jgi:hypothetical protein
VAFCDSNAGGCVVQNAADGSACDDGDDCTSGDTCNAIGECKGSAKDCSALDGACTTGVCNAGSCASENKADGTSCSDGNACTDSDICDGNGNCVGSTKLCDDGVACTSDSCNDAAGGCVFTPGAACTTFDADVKPILLVKCAPCHTVGTNSGLNVLTYSTTQIKAANSNCQGKTHGECMLIRIKNGTMPQNKGCNGDPVVDADNLNLKCLNQAQQDTLQNWINDGQLK